MKKKTYDAPKIETIKTTTLVDLLGPVTAYVSGQGTAPGSII